MLLSPRATGTSLGFLVGWVAGVAVVVTVVTLLVDPVQSDDSSEPSTTVAVVELVLGAAAVALAVKQWRGRPAKGQAGTLPGWMSAIDKMPSVRALGLAAVLAGVNPKNLTLCLAGAATIGSAGLSGGQTAVAIVVFVAIASSTVAVPVLGYLVARDRMAGPLDGLRDWLTDNNATVMSVLLLVIGVVILGKGIAGL
jgi:uncharacterized membrane protein YidH (DUF202 family)